MAVYSRPEHEASEVNHAARKLVEATREGATLDTDALAIVNKWRAAHDFPLNGIHMTMKGRAKRLPGGDKLTAQRIKRLDSILLKLQDRPTMKLSQMQDIGGCRVILPSIKHVYALKDKYVDHPVVHEMLPPKDYITDPVEDSGYRSLHLKFRYVGRGTSEPWNGLKIELQIRTLLQHRWATAVEAAGTLRGELFKSRRGDQDWRRFFQLASAAYAVTERTAVVPNTPTKFGEIMEELRALDQRHKIISTMAGYSNVISKIDKTRGAYYYLLHLDPDANKIQVWEYAKNKGAESADHLARLEQEVSRPAQVVRVSVSSVANLRRAYPNYFLDTKAFLQDLHRKQ